MNPLSQSIRLTSQQVYDLNKNVPIITPKSYGKSIKPADLPDGIARFFPVPSSAGKAKTTTPSPLTSSPSESGPVVGTGLPANILFPILINLRESVFTIRDELSKVHLRMVGASLLIVYEADWKRAEEGFDSWYKEEDEDEDEERGKEKPGSPYTVKLIDFAHTRLKPGQGPDEGLLKGLDTVIQLLDGRIEQVHALVKSI